MVQRLVPIRSENMVLRRVHNVFIMPAMTQCDGFGPLMTIYNY